MPAAIAGEETSEYGIPGYRFTIKSDVHTVSDYYESELSTLGWDLVTIGQGSTENIFAVFIRNNKPLSIKILVADKEANLILVVLSPT